MNRGVVEISLSSVHPGFVPTLDKQMTTRAASSNERPSRKDPTNRCIAECAPIGIECPHIQLPHFIEIL
jgi:hypothetical protein